MNKLNKIKSILKNYKISIPAILVILAVSGFFTFSAGKGQVKGEFLPVGKTDISQEVDVTGKVIPAKDVSLSIESGGKITFLNISEGSRVMAGQTLLRVDSSDLEIRLGRERASLEKAKIALSKQEPKSESSDDLVTAYEDGFSSVASAEAALSSLVDDLDDMMSANYLAQNYARNVGGDKAVQIRKTAEDSFDKAIASYQDSIDLYTLSSRQSSKEHLEKLVASMLESAKLITEAVKNINNFVDYMEEEEGEGVTPALLEDQSSLETLTGIINTEVSSLLDAKNSITDAKNDFTDESLNLSSSKIDIQQSELDIQETLNLIGKRSIRSPINGIVSLVSAELGETISAGTPVVKIISDKQYQVEADLPESDRAKIKIGASASIELSAYSEEVAFSGRVVSIDPSETVIDGVSTYRTTIEFTDVDERILPGMTAEVTIGGEKKENVIAVPQRAVISRNGKRYVQILVNEEIVEKEVETGMRGTDGNIEIKSGISEGDKVLVYSGK